MTWYLPAGETVISRELGRLMAQAILHMVSELEGEEDFEFRVPVFDSLSMEQKIVALYKVAFGLMDPKTHAVEHTAALEGCIAALFNLCAEYLDTEIETTPEKFFWRGMIQAACQRHYEESVPPDADYQEWRGCLDSLEQEILWDNDWSLDPGSDKKLMGIMPDYFSNAPRFPKPDKIETIQEKLIQFCESIFTE